MNQDIHHPPSEQPAPVEPHSCCHKVSPPVAVNVGDPDALYTCPMHPDVQHAGPANCPLCGMALEPLLPSAAPPENHELSDMKTRFLWSLLFALPLCLLAMGDMLPGRLISRVIDPDKRRLLELALATPVCLWAAWPFYTRALQSIRHRSPNMFTLIGLGVGMAYAYSVLAVLFPGFFPDAFRGMHGEVDVYFESGAVIVALVLLGQVLELSARAKTSSALRELLGMQAKTARVLLADGRESDVPLIDVEVGQSLRIRPGDTIPVDGTVIDGESLVNEAMVTGESMPVLKRAHDMVIGATTNGNGTFIMRADHVGSATFLARMVQLVSQAQRTRAPIQKLADRVAGVFVPAVVLAAVLTFVLWALWGPPPALAYALVNAVSVLIIACPCALGLATPMSIMVASGRGATHGVLFRHAAAIESLGKIDSILIDKTGTLTLGKPKLCAMEINAPWSDNEVLQLAASLEAASEHPLAEAIVEAAKDRKLSMLNVSQFQALTGKGIQGLVGNRQILVGNEAAMAMLGIPLGGVEGFAQAMRRDAKTVVYVVVDAGLAGVLAVADQIKPSAAASVRALRNRGIHIAMLSGDNQQTADAVGRELGISDVTGGLLPADKLAYVKRLQAEGRFVAMVGDGINDAPALAQANVGVAMGTGSDLAIGEADLTLASGDLSLLVFAHRLSRLTLRNIKQNLGFAFGYNLLGVPLAAGVLFPSFGLLLNPMVAAAAMSLSSVSVIGNALRLRVLVPKDDLS